MRVKKLPLVKDRVRRPPKEGWSWIDRRFLREFAHVLPQEAILLYFFLAAVSDQDGLSYYSDPTIASRLRLDEAALSEAREELERHDLIAYEFPLYQVLSLPPPVDRRTSSGPRSIGDVLREMARRHTEERERTLEAEDGGRDR